MKSYFSKHWDRNGFTMEEAVKKKTAVDEAHGVNKVNAKWNPAEIVEDSQKGGYLVVIETKALS